jgi:hypothetical protein
MYNDKHECMYNYDVPIPEISEQEKYLIQHKLYKQDILSIFGLDEFDETELNINVHKLYERITPNEKLTSLALKAAALVMSMDQELGFLVLFSFDYLYVTHDCMKDFLKSGSISDKNMSRLEQLIT